MPSLATAEFFGSFAARNWLWLICRGKFLAHAKYLDTSIGLCYDDIMNKKSVTEACWWVVGGCVWLMFFILILNII
jgi:hypothetical protein